MKKALFFAGLAAAALTFVGCNKEADYAGNGRKVEIVLSDVATRTINYGMSTEWKSGDELSVFTAPTGTDTWSSNIKFTVQDASANRAAGEVELTADAYDWYAFYPYTSQIPNPTTLDPEGSSHERSGYVTVGGQAQVQKSDDNKEHLAGTKVPVFGNVKNVPADEMPVIEMKNAASVACFKVTNALEEQIRILSVKFTAPEDIVGTYYIDFSGTAPAFVASGDTYVYDNVTVTNSDPSSIAPDSNGEFYAVIKPFTAAAGAKLTVEVEAESADGAKKATATKEVTLTAATEFKPGFIKTLNIPFDVALEETLPQELPYSEAFKGVGIGEFSIDNVSLPSQLSYVWTYDSKYGMKASAFVNGTAYQTESWLVSPLIDLTSAAVPQLSFKHAVNQFASVAKAKEEATVWARVKGGEWTKLEVNYPTGLGWTFVESGAVDLSDFAGNLVQIGFKYTSTADKAGTWEIQDFLVQDATEPEFGVEQASFNVAANVTSVTVNVTGNVAWTVQDVSEGVIATPDSGSGAGTIAVSFPANTDPIEKIYSLKVVTDNAQLVASSDEEFVIDITQAAASTEAKGYPFEWGFTEEQGQGDFTIIDVNKPAALDYVWSFDTRGFMKASAFKSNTYYDAESWLISPVVDLAAAQNPALTFAHATNYFTSVAKAQEETSVWVREEGGAWTAIEGVNYPTSLGWTFADSGSLDLSAYKGKKVQIGFKYTSTSIKSGTWEIQNFKLADATVDPVEPGVVTIDFSKQGLTNGQEVESVTDNGVTVSFDKGTNNNAPKYYDSGTAVRMYGSNSMTVTAGGKTIISIELTFGSSDGTNAITTNVPTYEEPAWTGEAGSVTFTIGGTTGQRRIKAIKVKYTDDAAPATPVNPTFTVTEALSVEVGATEKIDVTTNTDGAITYTSANTAVATVATDGTVTGVAAGSTTITVAAAATSAFNSASATVAVTVTEVDNTLHTIVVADYASTSFTAGVYSFTAAKAEAATAPAYNANGSDLRIYAKGTLTVSNSKENMTKIVFNLSTQGLRRLAPITASTGTIATQAENDTKVTWTGDASSVVFTVGDKANFGSDGDTANGQLCFTTVDVSPWSDGDVQPKTLSSIEVSGQKTTFTVGDTFSFGGTVTAVYSDGSRTAVAESDVTFSGHDMSTAGQQIVTVTYQTKTATYEITVNAKPDVSGDAWSEVPTLSDLTAGTFVITALSDNKYYAVPSTTINAQTFTCIEGVYNSTDKSFSPAEGSGEFVLTAGPVENSYYIYNTTLEKYLVATGSKKFGYVDNTSSDYGYWTFSAVTTGGFSGVFSVKHDNKSHYMRAYGSTVKCYDGASNSGVFFFKK